MNKVKASYRKPRLVLCNVNKDKISILTDKTKYSAYDIVLSEKTNEVTKLKFNIPFENTKIKETDCEKLIFFEGEYYIIKNTRLSDGTTRSLEVECCHEPYELMGVPCGEIDVIGVTVETMFNEVLLSSDKNISLSKYAWGGSDIPSTTKRHLQSNEERSLYENLVAVAKVFNGRLEFSTDSFGKIRISIYKDNPNNGKYIKKSKDLLQLNVEYSSEEIFTRLLPLGFEEDGVKLNIIGVNPTGKAYVENYDYYLSKGLTLNEILSDPKCTQMKTYENSDVVSEQDLYDVAIEELSKSSQPQLSGNVDIVDISIFEGSTMTPPKIGETVFFINRDINYKLSAVIEGIERNYDNPLRTKVQISNMTRYSSILKNLVYQGEVIDKLTNGKGDILDSVIKDNVERLTIKKVDVEDLNAVKANIKKLETEDLTAINAHISNLQTDKANIRELDAITANIEDLSATYADFEIAVTDKLIANEGIIQDLKVTKLDVEAAEIMYANIDFSNIDKATMGSFYADSGLIKNVVVGDQTITGELIGVTIKGDLIEGGTIIADKLVVKGTDGLYYKLNTDGMSVEAEQTSHNSLNGSIITAKSITATKISVSDLVAFDATIGGFKLTNKSIYSGVKETVNNTTRGIYLDNDGQMSIGDSSNFIKFYKDTDSKYKLAISASTMIMSSSNKTIEETLDDLKNNADLKDSRNWARGTSKSVVKSGLSGINSEGTALYKAYRGFEKAGDIITTSLTIRYKNLVKIEGQTNRLMCQGSGDITNWELGALPSFNFTHLLTFNSEEEKELRVVYKGTVTENMLKNNYWNMSIRCDYISSGEINISDFKFENGSNDNPKWSIAPEDTKQTIDSHNTSIEMLESSIESTVTEESLTEVIRDLESSIDKNSSDLNDLASKSASSNDLEESEKAILQILESKVSQTADDWKLEFTDVRKEIGEQADTISSVKSYFDFSSNGMVIGKNDSPLNITISNEQMSFINNDKVVAYINGQKMYIESLEVLSSLIVGVHKIEKYNATTTLIKYAGGN